MNVFFDPKAIEAHFEEVFEKLINGPKFEIIKSPEWLLNFKKEAGVYLLFKNGTPIYVGETGDLKGRMRDILNTYNHTFRRTYGTIHFGKHPEYWKPSSSKLFHHEIEKTLTELIAKEITVSTHKLIIGRKEFEDWVLRKHPNLINTKKGRNNKNHDIL